MSTCPYLVEDGASNGWRELGNMSTQNATEISLAVGVVWAIAWGFKQVGRLIRFEEPKE